MWLGRLVKQIKKLPKKINEQVRGKLESRGEKKNRKRLSERNKGKETIVSDS